MGVYLDYLKRLCPPWLAKPKAQRFLQAFGDAQDGLKADGVAMLRTSRLHQCDASALDAHARNSNLSRVRRDTDDTLRDYLLTRWDTWKLSGTTNAITHGLARLGFPNSRVVTWYDLIRRGVVSPFGGGYQIVTSMDPNGSIRYLARTPKVAVNHVGGISTSFLLTVSGTTITIQLATASDGSILSTANDLASAIRQHPLASTLLFATPLGTGNGTVAVGTFSLSFPYWSFFFVEISAADGFFKYSLWDDATDSTYNYGNRGPLTWQPVKSPTTQFLWGVYGTAQDDVWAVGDQGTILHYDGSAWSSVTSPTTEDLFVAFALAKDDAWACGRNGTLLHYDGSAWSLVTSPSTNLVTALWGSAKNSVWAVTQAGEILFYNGINWSSVPSPTTLALKALWGSSPNSIWAVGGDFSHNVFLHFNGITWTHIPSPSPTYQEIFGIWGSAANDIWAVGGTTGNAVIFHYDGTSWSQVPTATNPGYLWCIWGSGPTNLWAASGQFFHFSGGVWKGDSSVPGVIRSLWGSDENHAWAVGSNGSIYQLGPSSLHLWSGAQGTLWEGGETWDLIEPYVGALDEIRAVIRFWKPATTSCRFVRIQVGPEWITIPVGETWELDPKGNIPNFFSFDY